jgi:hypothetical protein
VRKQVPIDLELVQFAFEDRDGDGQWFLEIATGDAIRVGDDDDELSGQIEDGIDERYLAIPYQGPEAGYRDMAEFVESVADDRCRAVLEVAIRGNGAFRRFKDVLQVHLAERERWFAFQKERVHGRIRRWLEDEDIEPITRQPGSG